MKRPQDNSGFTLVELMVTLAIAIILLSVGVPSFTQTIQNNRLTTAANKLVSATNLARGEAIKRGTRVTVCKSSDGATCVAGGDWAQGGIIFTDGDNDAAFTAGSEELLRVAAGLGNNLTLTGAANVANYISYVGSGQSRLTTADGGSFQTGTVSLCDDRTGNFIKDITLSTTGRLSLTDPVVACP